MRDALFTIKKNCSKITVIRIEKNKKITLLSNHLRIFFLNFSLFFVLFFKDQINSYIFTRNFIFYCQRFYQFFLLKFGFFRFNTFLPYFEYFCSFTKIQKMVKCQIPWGQWTDEMPFSPHPKVPNDKSLKSVHLLLCPLSPQFLHLKGHPRQKCAFFVGKICTYIREQKLGTAR